MAPHAILCLAGKHADHSGRQVGDVTLPLAAVEARREREGVDAALGALPTLTCPGHDGGEGRWCDPPPLGLSRLFESILAQALAAYSES